MQGPAAWQLTRRVLALLFLGAVAARAQEGVRFDASGFGLVTLTGDTKPDVTPGGRISVDGPLVLGSRAIGRVYSRLDITALPGETVDLASVDTFRAAELSLGAYRSIGDLKIGNQEVVTSIAAEWGFGQRLAHDPSPAQRYPRHYGAGLRVDEQSSGASMSLLYGHAEAAGDIGFGQWQVSGQLPLGPVVLGGDAILSVGPPSVFKQRDIVRMWIGVSVPKLLEKLR
jgi:hypothetical protein